MIKSLALSIALISTTIYADCKAPTSPPYAEVNLSGCYMTYANYNPTTQTYFVLTANSMGCLAGLWEFDPQTKCWNKIDFAQMAKKRKPEIRYKLKCLKCNEIGDCSVEDARCWCGGKTEVYDIIKVIPAEIGKSYYTTLPDGTLAAGIKIGPTQYISTKLKSPINQQGD